MNYLTFEELDYKVIGWAAKKGILEKATPKDQFVKTVEEMGEVAAALARGDLEALKDGIGDVFVTLIILARLNGLDPVKCLEHAWNEIKDRTGEMKDGVFVKCV